MPFHGCLDRGIHHVVPTVSARNAYPPPRSAKTGEERQKRNSALHQSSRRFAKNNRRHRTRSSCYMQNNQSKVGRDSEQPESVTYRGRVQSYQAAAIRTLVHAIRNVNAGRTLIPQPLNLIGNSPRPADPHRDVDSCPNRPWKINLACSSETNAEGTTEETTSGTKNDD